MSTPWDIYVDERKVPGKQSLGFLLVPNTASFMHKLFRCRQHAPGSDRGRMETREIHWNNIHRGVLPVALHWIERVFQHRGAKFYLLNWPKTQTKEYVVIDFVRRFAEARKLHPPFNIVVFLDFDSSHARAKIQNTIREAAAIRRCYHLASEKNDCIQCADLLLGATALLGDDPTVRLEQPELEQRWLSGEKLRNSETKRYLAGYLGTLIDNDAKCVYDLRRKKKNG